MTAPRPTAARPGGLRPPARIARIETVLHPAHSTLVHVIAHADDGSTGTGETHGHPAAVAALIQEFATELIGVEATPARVADVCRRGPYGSTRGGGPVSVESRAASALDIAIWDLLARRLQVPLAGLLGGAARQLVPTYNTCTGPDHDESLRDPGAVASDLAADGFAMMKIWPFAPGRDIPADVDLVRAASSVGVAVAVDLVGQFDLATASRICGLLDPLGLAWIEDPAPDAGHGALAYLARNLTTLICTGERLAGADAYERLVSDGVVGIVHSDVAWCGGVSETLRIAAVAAAHGRPLTLHDASGPVAWATSLHVAQHLAVTTLVESSRFEIRNVYPTIADGLPTLDGGGIAPTGPGHGITLAPAYLASARRSSIPG